MEQNRQLADKPVEVPLLVLSGDAGSAPDLFEAIRQLGTNVRGGMIANSGHYIPEEQPEALADALVGFFCKVGNDGRGELISD